MGAPRSGKMVAAAVGAVSRLDGTADAGAEQEPRGHVPMTASRGVRLVGLQRIAIQVTRRSKMRNPLGMQNVSTTLPRDPLYLSLLLPLVKEQFVARRSRLILHRRRFGSSTGILALLHQFGDGSDNASGTVSIGRAWVRLRDEAVQVE